MSDFEDKLNKLLNDPDELERFAGFAKSLMSGGEEQEKETAPPSAEPELLKSLGGLLRSGAGGSRETRLLEAMRPYLSEKRRGKMDRALKLARLADLAERASESIGGDGDGGI